MNDNKFTKLHKNEKFLVKAALSSAGITPPEYSDLNDLAKGSFWEKARNPNGTVSFGKQIGFGIQNGEDGVDDVTNMDSRHSNMEDIQELNSALGLTGIQKQYYGFNAKRNSERNQNKDAAFWYALDYEYPMKKKYSFV